MLSITQSTNGITGLSSSAKTIHVLTTIYRIAGLAYSRVTRCLNPPKFRQSRDWPKSTLSVYNWFASFITRVVYSSFRPVYVQWSLQKGVGIFMSSPTHQGVLAVVRNQGNHLPIWKVCSLQLLAIPNFSYLRALPKHTLKPSLLVPLQLHTSKLSLFPWVEYVFRFRPDQCRSDHR